MASAKKGKKNKGKTLALSDFLQETPGTVATVPIRKSTTNWADEVEDNHDVYDPRSAKASVVLPTAPKASRDFDDIIDKVPQDPPFIAYLTNLPYDVDENEITYFFRNMKIANMRIPKDDRAGEGPRLKGFGYVEFEDRDSLLNALVIPDTTIKNRRIRIEVATDYGNDNRRGGRMDMNRDRGNRGESSFGDWRSGPRQESSDMERRGFSRDRDRDREGSDSSSMWRDAERRQPPPRDSDRPFTRSGDSDRPFTRSSDSDRPFTRSNDSDRPFTRSNDSDRPFTRSNDSDRPFTRSNDRYRGGDDRDSDFGRSRDDKFPPRRYDSDRDRDGQRDRPRNGGGGFTRSTAPPSRDEDSNRDRGGGGRDRDEQRQRPKLMLTPRTKPVEGEPEKVASSTSIFGNAKPVDTAARERQIEERLAKDHDGGPKRDVSRERKDVEREKKEKVVESEKRPEREKLPTQPPPSQKSDINGEEEKSQSQSPPPAQQPHPKRNGDHDKKEARVSESDKHKPDARKKDEKKEKPEKEMPKLKPAEAPNFVASNKFAFLETEDNSD